MADAPDAARPDDDWAYATAGTSMRVERVETRMLVVYV
jgi:hypothetical protein